MNNAAASADPRQNLLVQLSRHDVGSLYLGTVSTSLMSNQLSNNVVFGIWCAECRQIPAFDDQVEMIS